MAKKRKSNFRGRIAQNVKRRKREASSVGYLNLPKDIKLLSPDEETRKMNLDFLPYVVTHKKHPDQVDGAEAGELWFRSPFKVHRDVGVNGDTIVCPTSIGKPCPICEYMAKLRKEGRDWDEIKVYRASPRALYAVMPLSLRKHDEDIYILDISDFLFFNELQDHLELNEEDEVFPDIEEGKTARLRLKWKSFGNNKFYELVILGFEDRDPYEESIIDDIPQLDDVLNILSYNELENKFLEMEDEISDETLDDKIEDEQPKRSKYRRSTPDEEKDDEPEEKETPKRKTVRRRSAAKEEPEEEKKETSKRSKRSKDNPDCPYKHKFGEDFEKFDDCAECEKWDECEEANNETK